MKQLTAKMMVSLACVIILLHAMVPHHHHDCNDEVGFIFETELGCHCDSDCDHHADCHHHGSHHPFDTCKLQDMLSHLILSGSDDKYYYVARIKAEAQSFLHFCHPTEHSDVVLADLGTPFRWPVVKVSDIAAPYMGTVSLRAPPFE